MIGSTGAVERNRKSGPSSSAPAADGHCSIAISELYKSLKARIDWPFASFPRLEEARGGCEELATIRDRLKSRLFEMDALTTGEGLDDHHDSLVSITCLYISGLSLIIFCSTGYPF